MNKTLEISAMQYDFHTLLKVSDICGLTGEIGFHDTDTGYLVSFPDDDGKAEPDQEPWDDDECEVHFSPAFSVGTRSRGAGSPRLIRRIHSRTSA